MRTNVAKKKRRYTHEGGRAKGITPEMELRRTVLSCLLWEKTFYESGEDVVSRIKNLVPKVAPEKVFNIACKARNEMYLRHAPLMIALCMAASPTHKKLVGKLLPKIIQRPDEITEFLSLYWQDGKCPLSNQIKKGIAKAFTKFDEYQLAKYNRDGVVRLRDALFLSHAKPKDKVQEALWKRLVDGELATPDTWEVALSGGADKKEAWTRLLKEERLGGMALLRNLRNMQQAGVDKKLICRALESMRASRILPFRFIAAANHAPDMEPWLETAMLKNMEGMDKLSGHTVLLIDGSGSMYHPISSKSELDRFDAACGLAVLLRELCEDINIATFSIECRDVPPRRGFGLVEAAHDRAEGMGTYLAKAMRDAKRRWPNANRLVVITDEQSNDGIEVPHTDKAYLINVATYLNGVGYGEWVHIDGWSEGVVRFIQEIEQERSKLRWAW